MSTTDGQTEHDLGKNRSVRKSDVFRRETLQCHNVPQETNIVRESSFSPVVGDLDGQARRLAVCGLVWVKWFAKAPVGYVPTGVYCASTDEYLWEAQS